MPPSPNTWRIAAVTSLAVVAGGITWVTLDPGKDRTDGPLTVSSSQTTTPTSTAGEDGSITDMADANSTSPDGSQATAPPSNSSGAPTKSASLPETKAPAAPATVTQTPKVPADSRTPERTIKPTIKPNPPAPATNTGTLKITGINVAMPIIPVGVDADTGMTVPEKPEIAGWYKFGPAPGDAEGSAVITAHVDSKKYGPGPLAALRRTQPGATITVTHNGEEHRYRVTRTDQYKKTALDTAKLFDRSGPHRLHVVTCGGKFNRKTGHYDDNVVVLAEPIR